MTGSITEEKPATSIDQILESMQESGVGLEEIEQQLLDAALEKSGGNVSAASRALNISTEKYRYRIQKTK